VGLVVGVAGLIAAGGVAWATIPDSTSGVVTACAASGGGTLRAIDAQSGQTCAAGEVTLQLGRGLVPRGFWSSSATYQPGDVVSYKGSSYVAIAPNSATKPSNASDWMLMAKMGATGATGPKGDPGPPGPSAAYTTTNTSKMPIPHGSTTVASLSLPAGSFVYTGTVSISNSGSSTIALTCEIVDPSGAVVTDIPVDSVTGTYDGVTLTGASNSVAGVATLICNSFNAQAYTLFQAGLTAVQAGSLTTQ
jgi:hypothetical protein